MPLCSFLGGLGFLEDVPSPRPPFSLGALRDSGSPLINQPVEPQVGRGLPEEDLTAAYCRVWTSHGKGVRRLP